MCRTTREIIDIDSADLLISLIKENMQFEKYSYLMFKKKNELKTKQTLKYFTRNLGQWSFS